VEERAPSTVNAAKFWLFSSARPGAPVLKKPKKSVPKRPRFMRAGSYDDSS